MLIGFSYSLISALFYSVNNIFSKKITQKVNELETFFISNMFLTIISGFIAFTFGDFNFTFNLEIFLIVLIGSLFGFIAFLCFLYSFKNFYVSESLVIANTNPFVVLIFSILLFNEKISLIEFIGMITVFYGIYSIIRNKSKFRINKNVILPFITSLGWGVYSLVIITLLRLNMNIFYIVFILEAGILLFLIFYLLLFKIKINKKIFTSSYILKNGFLAGITTNFGTLFSTLAFKTINPPIASSIISSQVLFASFFGYLFLKEKVTHKQFIGYFLVFLGLVIFYFF